MPNLFFRVIESSLESMTKLYAASKTALFFLQHDSDHAGRPAEAEFIIRFGFLNPLFRTFWKF